MVRATIMASAATASMCNQEVSIPKRYVKETVSTPPTIRTAHSIGGRPSRTSRRQSARPSSSSSSCESPLAHQGPLLLDHDPGVEDDDLLDLTPLRLRETRGELVELFYVGGLTLRHLLGRVELLLHEQEREPERNAEQH